MSHLLSALWCILQQFKVNNNPFNCACTCQSVIFNRSLNVSFKVMNREGFESRLVFHFQTFIGNFLVTFVRAFAFGLYPQEHLLHNFSTFSRRLIKWKHVFFPTLHPSCECVKKESLNKSQPHVLSMHAFHFTLSHRSTV